MRTTIIILIVISLGLGTGLLVRHQKAEAQLKVAARENARLAAEWQEARQKVEEQQKVAAVLENNLSLRTQELAETSNSLTATRAELATVQGEVVAVQAEVQKRDAQIAQLEDQRDDMSKKLDDLASSINTLEVQIADTKGKLASSEGDRDYLLKELNRMQAEKAELVRQFNDVAVLRAQVAKLRNEAVINQRLDWMQKGIYAQHDRKGAQALMSKTGPAVARADRRLNVELDQEGGVKVEDSSTPTPNRQ